MQYANLDRPPAAVPRPSSTGTVSRASSKPKRKKLKKIVLFVLLFFFVFGLYNFSPFILQLTKLIGSSPRIVYSVIANKDPNLKSQNGRTNILLFGTGGGTHDGPNLTDSILVASVDIKTGDAVLFSFPRDVYIPDTQAKINATYQYGLDKGNGLGYAEQIFSKYTGLPIDYAIRIDFDGFRKAIDLVGGVDVTVENTFDDYQYPADGRDNDTCGFIETTEPITASSPKPLANAAASSSATASAAVQPTTRDVFINKTTGQKIYADEVSDTNNPYACRFEHIHFDKGVQHMDGTTALKFVRSRHASGVEGSDFARSRRQQAVILAFRQAVTSKETLFDIGKVQSLVQTFGSSIDTDISTDEYGDFYQLYKRIKQTPIRTFALSDGSDGGLPVFYNPPMADYGGAWVLAPKGNDWDTVRQAIQQALLPPTPTPIATGSAQPSVRRLPTSQ